MTSTELEYTINAPPEAVYLYFLEFEKFAELHPYMTEAKKLDAKTYAIREKLLLYGFIPMRPFYNAQVEELEKASTILYTSHVKKGVDLTIRFNFSAKGNKQTIIKESIEVNANKLVAVLFIGLMKKAHKKLFKNLANAVKSKTAS